MFGGNTGNNPFGSGNSASESGSFFTAPFTAPTPETDKSDGDVSKREQSTEEHYNIVRPSIFGHALSAVVKALPKKPSVTSNDILSLQSLYVPDVPAELLDKKILLDHFSQYSKVTRIYIHPARKSCTLNFESHEAAERAKTWGTMIGSSPIKIFWAKPANRRSEGRRSSTSKSSPRDSIKEDSKRSLSQSPKKVTIDDDVQDELACMQNSNAASFSDTKPVPRQTSRERRPQVKQISALTKMKKERSKSSSRENSPGSLSTSKSAAAGGGDSEVLYGSAVSADELQTVMRTAAHSAEERYRVLEARDKLMRLRRVRQFNLATARINRGICQDMCPEKERYLREFQRQVATYEHVGVPGKIDHKKAVKQYSRSSADQEEPLAHELRPAPALRLTMNYLMWRMMDVCDKKDENMADWYHFIWDRTRGIRKDITQQELCDANSVVLVEQCARWHIFCSERLIAEDLSVYDDNINTENLTKCLQTLKYMYQDMALKGISCPNEAEFRAYFVLLNLNEGDCMWEVQQLRSEIRESEPVRFALQVSAALASNNYIRFFKLVRASTYLNACILHRYFAQVRSHALTTIVKAFCSRAIDSVFTLDEVVKLAGLEDANEAARLCMHHGLKLTDHKTAVIMSRTSFTQPDTPLLTTRVLSLVEAKRTCSVGETVCGSAQSDFEFETHVPHDSFDAKGLLRSGAWTASDQDIHNTLSEPVQVQVQVEQTPVAESERIMKEADDSAERQASIRKAAVAKQVFEMKIAKIFKDVIEEVTNDEACSVVGECMKSALQDAASFEFMDEILCMVTSEITSEVCGEVLQSEIDTERQRILAERLASEAEMLRKMQEKKFLQELNNYLDEFMGECAEQVIQDELALEELQKKLTTELIEHFVHEECMRIAKEVIAEAQAVEADAIFARIQIRRMKTCFQQWKTQTAKWKFRKQSMADFPAWMSNLSLNEQASDLDLPDTILIQNMNPNRFAALRSQRIALEQETRTIPPINIGQVVAHQLLARMKEIFAHEAYVYWKVFTSIPDSAEAPQNFRHVQSWTESLFSFKPGQLISVSQIKPSLYETLTISVRRQVGTHATADQCQGTNGILFWISHKETSFEKAKQRLSAVILAKPRLPAVPVAVVLTGPMNTSYKQIQRLLDLHAWRRSGHVSYYKVFALEHNTKEGLLKQMESSCKWLAELCPAQPALMVTSLHRLMDQYLAQDLWMQVKFSVQFQDPNIMIGLYNKAVTKVTDLVSDKTLFDYSLGGNEFIQHEDDSSYREQRKFQIAPDNWGSTVYLPPVIKVLSAAKIPKMKRWPPQGHNDLQNTLIDYCNAVGVPKVISQVYQIIENHARIESIHSHSTPSDWKRFINTLPWSTVIQTIVEAKLQTLNYSFASRRDSGQAEIRVVVHRQSLKQLQGSTWWIGDDELAVTDEVPDCNEEEKSGQKRMFEGENQKSSKQRRISTLSEIKAKCNSIDSNISAVRATWAELAAKWGNRQS